MFLLSTLQNTSCHILISFASCRSQSSTFNGFILEFFFPLVVYLDSLALCSENCIFHGREKSAKEVGTTVHFIVKLVNAKETNKNIIAQAKNRLLQGLWKASLGALLKILMAFKLFPILPIPERSRVRKDQT